MQSLVGVAVGALGAYVVYRLTCGTKTPKSLKLTYFDIKAAPGEKIRLTLKLAGVPFIDRRVKFPDWPELKKKTKYGQMPFVEADGEEYFQSGSLLRWTGQMGSGALYPASTDPIACRKIEEMMGFAEDLTRAWQPAMYISMRHEGYGHPKEWPAKEETVKMLREKFVADELPKYMVMLTAELEKTGAFLCGASPTIADCQLVPQLDYFTRGVADHVPKDCLDKYPAVTAYIARFKALPALKGHYD